MEVMVPLRECVSNEGLWQKKPRMKLTTRGDAKLMEAVKIRCASGLLGGTDQSRLEAILRGEDPIWKIWRIRNEGENSLQLKLVGRFEQRRWARRGDFATAFEYHAADIDLEMVDMESVMWKTVTVDDGAGSGQWIDPKYPGTLPRAAIARAVTA